MRILYERADFILMDYKTKTTSRQDPDRYSLWRSGLYTCKCLQESCGRMWRGPGVDEARRRQNAEAVLCCIVEKQFSKHVVREIKARLSIIWHICIGINRGGDRSGTRSRTPLMTMPA